jgi:ABC-type polysaccharide/polyol phosphate export permease
MISLFSAYKKNRFLIAELLKQNLFTQYKQSKFSLFWIVFNPFFQIIIWSILHLSGFLKIGNVEVPYVIYLVSGITLWWYSFSLYESISNIYIKYTNVILENRFDILVLVVEAIIRQTIFFMIHLAVLFVLCVIYKITFYPIAVLYPFFIVPLILFSVALGLIFATIRVLSVDFAMIFDKIFGLSLFLTPILFKPTFNNTVLKYIIKFNPLSYLITFPRNLLLYGKSPSFFVVIFIVVLSITSIVVAMMYFEKMKYKTIEKLLQ